MTPVRPAWVQNIFSQSVTLAQFISTGVSGRSQAQHFPVYVKLPQQGFYAQVSSASTNRPSPSESMFSMTFTVSFLARDGQSLPLLCGSAPAIISITGYRSVSGTVFMVAVNNQGFTRFVSSAEAVQGLNSMVYFPSGQSFDFTSIVNDFVRSL